MKNYILFGMLLFTGILSAQKQPVLEQYGDMVKATYMTENGQIAQQGFFKNGKLEGQWVSYDESGNKKAVAEYKDGAKIGQWLFWNDGTLNEVTYSDSRLASVKNWKQDALVRK